MHVAWVDRAFSLNVAHQLGQKATNKGFSKLLCSCCDVVSLLMQRLFAGWVNRSGHLLPDRTSVGKHCNDGRRKLNSTVQAVAVRAGSHSSSAKLQKV